MVVSPSLPAFASLGCLLPVLNLPKPSATTFGRCRFYLCSSAHTSKLVSHIHKINPRSYRYEGLWSRQESNLDLVFRKHLFYPLNYGTIGYLVAEDRKNNHIIWYLYASNTTQYGFLQYHY